jgi:hypothetical protein
MARKSRILGDTLYLGVDDVTPIYAEGFIKRAGNKLGGMVVLPYTTIKKANGRKSNRRESNNTP